MRVPAIATLEFTNYCNFHCVYCWRFYEEGRRKLGFVKKELIELMIERKEFENTIYIEFHQNGEATMHPQFSELVKLIKTAVPYVGLSSNGTFVNFRNNAIEGIRLLDHLTLSIHSETKQEDIIKVLELLEGSKTKVRIQTIGGQTYKIDFDQFKKYKNVFFDNNPLRERNTEYGEPKFCLDLSVSVTVQWDGDVVPCCNVVGKQKVLGNLYKEPLEVIWERHDKKIFDYCKTCLAPSPYLHRLNFFVKGMEL